MYLEITAIVAVVFLVIRELLNSRRTRSSRRMARNLLIPIIPLLVAFLIMLAIRIGDVISG